MELSGDYNVLWLEAEYHQTVATANMAAKWEDFQHNKDLYPNLKYVTVGDSRVRPEHKVWEGVIKPLDDPWWDTHLPPNDWGCRCDVEQTDEEPNEIPTGGTQLKIEFANNPVKTGEIFNGNAYEDTLNDKEVKEAVSKSTAWMAKHNKKSG